MEMNNRDLPKYIYIYIYIYIKLTYFDVNLLGYIRDQEIENL